MLDKNVVMLKTCMNDKNLYVEKEKDVNLARIKIKKKKKMK
jgi:hypothetical protein